MQRFLEEDKIQLENRLKMIMNAVYNFVKQNSNLLFNVCLIFYQWNLPDYFFLTRNLNDDPYLDLLENAISSALIKCVKNDKRCHEKNPIFQDDRTGRWFGMKGAKKWTVSIF